MNVPVRVWHAPSSSHAHDPIGQCCQAWLSPDEQARADRFRQATSRSQHVIGRGMARKLLGGDAVTPESIRFDLETYGKPFVVAPESAKQSFNVAHTDGLVLCGITEVPQTLLGIDVERLHRRTDPALAERYFSLPEIEYLRSKSDPDQHQEAFLRVWTLKESFIKAIGTGLQTPLADFAFEDIDSPSPTIRMLNPELDSDRHWNFFSFQPRPGFVAAAAVATLNLTARATIEMCEFESIVSMDD